MLGHWSQSNCSTYPAQLSIIIVWVACNEEIKSILQPTAYGAFSVGEWTATCLRKTWCSATLSRGSLERQGETHFFRKVTYNRNVLHEKPHYFWKERIVQCMMVRQCNQTAIKNSTGLKHMSISNTCANRLPIADTRSRVGRNEGTPGKTRRKLLIHVLTLMWWRLPTCAETIVEDALNESVL